MAIQFAITGGIACGKTLFTNALQRLGVDVVDTDDITHQLQQPGASGTEVIVEHFGSEVLLPSGGVDRVALGELVFNTPAELKRLNQLLHPLIRDALRERLSVSRATLQAAVVPLLFEAGWESDWEIIVCLVSSRESQISRLINNRGMSKEQALKRVAAQMPIEEKAARSDLVVTNNAGKEELAQEAARIVALLKARLK